MNDPGDLVPLGRLIRVPVVGFVLGPEPAPPTVTDTSHLPRCQFDERIGTWVHADEELIAAIDSLTRKLHEADARAVRLSSMYEGALIHADGVKRRLEDAYKEIRRQRDVLLETRACLGELGKRGSFSLAHDNSFTRLLQKLPSRD